MFEFLTTVCFTRYKTKPGVVYHMTHHHNDAAVADDVEGGAPGLVPPPLLQPMDTTALASISKHRKVTND